MAYRPNTTEIKRGPYCQLYIEFDFDFQLMSQDLPNQLGLKVTENGTTS